MFGGGRKWRPGQTAEQIFPMFASAEDFDFHAEKEHGDLGGVNIGEAHGIFFRGDKGIEGAPVAPFEKAKDFLFGEAVVVGKTLGDFHIRAEAADGLLEAFRPCDTAHGSDMTSAQVGEGKPFAGSDVLPMAWRVVALDNGGGGVEVS